MRPSTLQTAYLRRGLLLAAFVTLAGCGSDYCGNCSFGPAVEVSLGLVAGNFANNGLTTIVATGTVEYPQPVNSGDLKVYAPSGAGVYGMPTLIADGDDPLYLASDDLNGDKLPDIVSASYSDGALLVFFNSTQMPGTFSTPLVLSSPGASQVAIGDLNGDGLKDLVSADFGVSLFIQTSPGAFASPISLYQGGANWVAVGDLNHDGSPDVALTDAVGVKVLMHTGAASATTFAAPVSVFTQTANANLAGANIIAIADVDGDGYNDLVITDPGPTGGAAPTVNILFQDSTHPGQFLTPVSYPVAPHSLAQSIIVTDLNGDGLPDIIIGGTDSVTVLLQNPDHTFAPATNYAAPNANQIAVADVNGDGHPDIIVSAAPAQTLVNGVLTNAPGVLLQNAGTGTFGALQALP